MRPVNCSWNAHLKLSHNPLSSALPAELKPMWGRGGDWCCSCHASTLLMALCIGCGILVIVCIAYLFDCQIGRLLGGLFLIKRYPLTSATEEWPQLRLAAVGRLVVLLQLVVAGLGCQKAL